MHESSLLILEACHLKGKSGPMRAVGILCGERLVHELP